MERHLGRYEIQHEIGRGEVGVVYKAYDPLIDRFVAVKAINLKQLNNAKKEEEYKARFYQEAKAAGRLNHPNIITVYDLGRKGEVAYIAMELIEGAELQDLVRDSQDISLIKKLDILCQVAAGLAYAHEHGIVHRDIKPSNIMLSRDGYVKIADFGIARMDSSLWRTQVNEILGTPTYMSPEQVQSRPVDSRSDIFSLGILMYRMLTGKLPFDGENTSAVLYQIVNEDAVRPCCINPDLPEQLDLVVLRCLAKDPMDRYQSTLELLDELKRIKQHLPEDEKSRRIITDDIPIRANLRSIQVHAYKASEQMPERQPWAAIILTALSSFAAYYVVEHLALPFVAR